MRRVADPSLDSSMLPGAWRAQLDLGYRFDGERTVLTTRVHQGPLIVQKSLYPEGGAVCQNVIVHPPGGIVGGDTLAVNVDAGPGAHAQLTTPGAAKCDRSRAFAHQRIGPARRAWGGSRMDSAGDEAPKGLGRDMDRDNVRSHLAV
jgi:hypothetical protein